MDDAAREQRGRVGGRQPERLVGGRNGDDLIADRRLEARLQRERVDVIGMSFQYLRELFSRRRNTTRQRKLLRLLQGRAARLGRATVETERKRIGEARRDVADLRRGLLRRLRVADR